MANGVLIQLCAEAKAIVLAIQHVEINMSEKPMMIEAFEDWMHAMSRYWRAYPRIKAPVESRFTQAELDAYSEQEARKARRNARLSEGGWDVT
jgi:hypothetical protein